MEYQPPAFALGTFPPQTNIPGPSGAFRGMEYNVDRFDAPQSGGKLMGWLQHVFLWQSPRLSLWTLLLVVGALYILAFTGVTLLRLVLVIFTFAVLASLVLRQLVKRAPLAGARFPAWMQRFYSNDVPQETEWWICAPSRLGKKVGLWADIAFWNPLLAAVRAESTVHSLKVLAVLLLCSLFAVPWLPKFLFWATLFMFAVPRPFVLVCARPEVEPWVARGRAEFLLARDRVVARWHSLVAAPRQP